MKKLGWTIPKEGERTVRDREHGLAGQEIWFRLEELGFVQRDMFPTILTPFEEKLKSWLIWGYWETKRKRMKDLGIIKKWK